MFLKGAAIALTLAGTMLATAGPSNAQGIAIHSSDRGHDRTGASVSFNFGDVAFGYQDGYWDNNRRWHKWNNRGDHDNYRAQHGDKYRNGNHTRYKGQGWRKN
jgi:hypothetical protein